MDRSKGGAAAMGKKLSVVVPCLNEEETIFPLYEELSRVVSSQDAELIFVNDGSQDNTVKRVRELQTMDSRVRLLSFIRNYGHQAALRAGICCATGDFIVTLDGDLQHPPRYIPEMIAAAEQGYDVVTMAHHGRQKGLFKQFNSDVFYWVFSTVSGVPMHPGASDFRLISKSVQRVIARLPERHLFFRALIPKLGFRTKVLPYELDDRVAGQASYTFSKSFKLAKQSLFNYSTVPITICFNVGIAAAGLAFVYGIVNVMAKFFTDWNIPGFTDIIASVLFLGGLNLVMLATIAKYIQITMEHVKQHPDYIIDDDNSDLSDHPRPGVIDWTPVLLRDQMGPVYEQIRDVRERV
jgi:dolichol-phosphate mannosyltransferase